MHARVFRTLLVVSLSALLTACSSQTTQTPTADTSSNSAELTDVEIADVATQYTTGEEISALKELNDVVSPVMHALIDGTYTSDMYESLSEVETICNAVIDMDDVPEEISLLHEEFVGAARAYRDTGTLLGLACLEYESFDAGYAEDLTDAIDSYGEAAEHLENALDEYSDIVRRSREERQGE